MVTPAEAFETAAYAAGGVVAMMRSHQEWSASPHARALAELPLVSIEKIGEAAPKPWSQGGRPLAGVRVLDLSRVIAGPVAGQARPEPVRQKGTAGLALTSSAIRERSRPRP